VKVYIDTNTVVARAVTTHVHNANAVVLFRQIQSRRWIPVISTHGLAEIYAVLTGTPFQPRITPAAAWQILHADILEKFEIESLARNDYREIIKDCAAQSWSGGRVYDALHVATARKAQCDRIYTFNVRHFRSIAPDLSDRIMAP
jgi:predicted nucleic acid-binding protein